MKYDLGACWGLYIGSRLGIIVLRHVRNYRLEVVWELCKHLGHCIQNTFRNIQVELGAAGKVEFGGMSGTAIRNDVSEL